MSKFSRAFTISAIALATLAGSTGCVVAVGNGGWDAPGPEISRKRMSMLIDTNRGVNLGDSREAVLANGALGDHASLFSSREYDGRVVQEWRVRARHDDRVFERWYYFVDGRLAAFGDDRIEYDDGTASLWIG